MEFQDQSISSWIRVAIASLFCIALFLCAGTVQAQVATDDDAKRIEALRDHAARDVDAAVDTSTSVDPSITAQPAEAVSTDAVPLPANESLPLGAGEGDLFSGGSSQADSSSLGDGWLLSTLAALGVVLAIVFGIRWLLKRGGVVSPAVSSGSVVEVLSRTTVAPRSHVVLMRVGQRILVVSDSSAGMRTLASVDDPEEVADLLGAIDSAKPTSMSQSFGSVMKKLSGQWSADEADYEESPGLETKAGDDAIEAAQGALSRVRGRLAALSEAGGRS